MTPGATGATLRHGLLHGQKHPVFSCQHTHIILLGDIPYPIGRYGVPDRIWRFCGANFIFCDFVTSAAQKPLQGVFLCVFLHRHKERIHPLTYWVLFSKT